MACARAAGDGSWPLLSQSVFKPRTLRGLDLSAIARSSLAFAVASDQKQPRRTEEPTMNAFEVGKKLVEFCKQNKNLESVNTLYSPDIVSVEAAPPPNGGDRVTKGIEAVRGKNQWWTDNHEVHSSETYGPFPHGDDKFAVRFIFDITHKPSKQRQKMEEIAVFTVENGKVVREEFFYSM
jgi:hypothetical protein